MQILIVGCSGGIGGAIARRLSSEGHTLIGIDKAKPGKDLHISKFYKVDLNSQREIADACRAIRKSKSKLWAIVYCAGIYPIVKFDDYTAELWDSVNNVNLKAAFMILKDLSPFIVNGGRIVTIASGAAHIGSRDLAYSASKAGLIGLTKSLAMNLSERGILANSICPGLIDTQMSRRMSSERVKQHLEKALIKRMGDSDEVAIAVEFLLSKENTYMTGATIDVNGGLYLR